MIPAEAALALVAHLGVPKSHVAVWVHRSPLDQLGANPRLHVSINPEYKGDRRNIPAQFNNYMVEKQPWSTPIEGEALEFAEKNLMEPSK